MPKQHNYLGRRNDYVMKIYAVKGQNCQNEQFNFPWTIVVLKDQNFSIAYRKARKSQFCLLLNESN